MVNIGECKIDWVSLWYYLRKEEEGEGRGRELEERGEEGFAKEHDLKKEKAGLERARQRDAIAATEKREKRADGKMEGFLFSRV